MVAQAMLPGMSVSGLAMSNQVNANQLRRWVQLRGKRGAGPATTTRLLPVTVVARDAPTCTATIDTSATVEIELAGAVVRVRDGVARSTLCLVLEALRGSVP